jgi:polyferredoxin
VKVTTLRLAVQHAAFLVSTYGGRLGISLGAYVPCLSCPFGYSCSGYCYLLHLQRSLGTLLTPLAWLAGGEPGPLDWENFRGLWKGLLVFSVLVIILGKSWCGWICPFGLVQDWLSRLRRALRVRESDLGPRTARGLRATRSALLACILALPPAAAAGALPSELVLAFCGICPAKAVMPLFGGEARYLALDLSTGTALALSLALLLGTGATLAGCFVRDRLFCLVCPMLALINLYRRLFLLRTEKDPEACRGCGGCRRGCAVESAAVWEAREAGPVYGPDCTGCFTCAEGCPSDGSLAVRLGPLRLFGSSRRYAAGRRK